MNRIALIVLAAGSSERFGALDKLATPIAGRALLAWTLELATHDAIDRADRIVVVGPGSAGATRIATASGWRTTFAHDAPRGMGASLQAGLATAGTADDVAGAIVVLGDDPLAARMLAPVHAAATAAPSTPVAVRRTPFLPHPVYLPRTSWPAGGADLGDHGLRGVLETGEVNWLDDDGAHPVDVDVPADVASLVAALSAGR